ncbi:hypothetical protein EBR56_11320, partial [bacterium]|nr:hypothetical protein [bacterium]
DDWGGALTRHYGVGNLAQMQQVWLDWVKQGCPAPPAALAAAPPRPNAVVGTTRGQSPDPPPVAPPRATMAAVSTAAGRRSIYATQARQATTGDGQPEPGLR